MLWVIEIKISAFSIIWEPVTPLKNHWALWSVCMRLEHVWAKSWLPYWKTSISFCISYRSEPRKPIICVHFHHQTCFTAYCDAFFCRFWSQVFLCSRWIIRSQQISGLDRVL